jgi:hypothetical protein
MEYHPYTLSKVAAAVTAAIVLFSSDSVSALINDDHALAEGAKLCTSYLPRHEREYGIPEHLLAAIASTESGRYNRELGLSLPWPWTINVEGKGYFFDTKQEAIAAVQKLQARGFQSIDVGCMQVNLHHHPNAFSSLDEAFEPAYNVAYAAQFLKRNFQDEGSWRKATADYHSRSQFFGEQYARLVYSSWSRIINKVADARNSGVQPGTIQIASLPEMNPLPANPMPNDLSRKPRHYYHPLHMHKISVRGTSRESGVLIIRPQHGESVRQQAQAEDAFVTHNVKTPMEKQADLEMQEKQKAEAKKAAQVTVVKENSEENSSAKGQFEASHAHIIHVNDNTTTDKPAKQNSVFVFDN